MDWRLLLNLATGYTVLFFLLGWATRPGMKYLAKRFQQEFHQPISEEAVEALSLEDRATWDQIYNEYRTSRYRWLEVLYLLFHYPSIIVNGIFFRRDSMQISFMYFITGTTYVAAFYFVLR